MVGQRSTDVLLRIFFTKEVRYHAFQQFSLGFHSFQGGHVNTINIITIILNDYNNHSEIHLSLALDTEKREVLVFKVFPLPT